MYLKISDILATCFLTPKQGWQPLGKWQEDHSSVPERQVSFPVSMGKIVNIYYSQNTWSFTISAPTHLHNVVLRHTLKFTLLTK